MSVYIFMKTLIFALVNKNTDKAIILGYISFYTNLPAILISKLFKIKLITIVPDLPSYALRYSKNENKTIRNYLFKIVDFFNNLIQKQSDGYVFLTKYMNELVNIYKKPYIIMEGFINIDDFDSNRNIHEKRLNVVMYAGTLHEKFGIKKLIEAFLLINMNEYELWIYGSGDYLPEIIKVAELNQNIKYKGTLPKKEIINIEKKVSLLVNCRPVNEDFTKYSFPSKTLEYMASGTPLLTTKLPGIPEEYYSYIYTFDNEDVDSIANKIEYVLNLPINEKLNFGMEAKQFVENSKNNVYQALRIYDLLVNI